MLIGDKPSEQRGVTQDGSAEVVSVTIDAASDRDGKVTASPDHGRIAVQDRHDHGDGVLAVDPAVRDNRRHHAGGQSQSARTVTAIARARACRRHAKRLAIRHRAPKRCPKSSRAELSLVLRARE